MNRKKTKLPRVTLDQDNGAIKGTYWMRDNLCGKGMSSNKLDGGQRPNPNRDLLKL